jgi:hypothetical protein
MDESLTRILKRQEEIKRLGLSKENDSSPVCD